MDFIILSLLLLAKVKSYCPDLTSSLTKYSIRYKNKIIVFRHLTIGSVEKKTINVIAKLTFPQLSSLPGENF